MKLIIKLFVILIILIGISLIIKPDFIFDWLESNVENTSLYIAAISVRLAFGILFIVAAKESKYPKVIQFFGFLATIAAIIFLFMGHERFKDFASSMLPEIKSYALMIGFIATAIGVFFAYAFSGTRNLMLREK